MFQHSRLVERRIGLICCCWPLSSKLLIGIFRDSRRVKNSLSMPIQDPNQVKTHLPMSTPGHNQKTLPKFLRFWSVFFLNFPVQKFGKGVETSASRKFFWDQNKLFFHFFIEEYYFEPAEINHNTDKTVAQKIDNISSLTS